MKPLFTDAEWDLDLLHKIWAVIDDIGKNTFKLDYYEPIIEIITAEQMLDNYSSHAMPRLYPHWSFGKSFARNENLYKSGNMGLAYEVVINTNPTIAYLMENNTSTMQALVLAHAVCGHGTFFKTNYLFKNWTDADFILDYLDYARNYIVKCEKKHGENAVETLLDACHSLQAHGIDKYKKSKISQEVRRKRQEENERYTEAMFNDIWRTTEYIQKPTVLKERTHDSINLPEENLLYFIEKYSPILETWEREIVRIVRKISQYFYPQRQTQLLNEGFACLVHHTIMTELHDRGHITDGSYLEFLTSHTGVIKQLPFSSKYFSGINVYALGFAMLNDIKRICEGRDLTDEDRKWFPTLCNTEWLPTIKHIVENYRDESFILQYLSPKVIRDLELFSINISDKDMDFYTISATQDDEDVHKIRQLLAEQYDINRSVPNIEVVGADWDSDRTLHCVHYSKDKQLLDYEEAKKTTEYLHQLWGFPVHLEYRDYDGSIIDEV